MLMEIQIFGVKKSADTRKAVRFFSERRIRTHFIDLNERELAMGELQRFVDKFGVPALIDRESKRFTQLGLQYSQLSDARWIDRVLSDPLLLRMPLVRRLGQPPALTVGDSEETWRQWVK